ncbi:hypothetical protein PCIT_a3998 [Pseudoalteromonas citrea]|uniref:Uncharacterized protein n=2 Tax=Pseudoalteromonas citrea TaxID=43655 RepID=A0AAD4FRY8_9GAMM|nr:hypothetical protein [Pseudoalteromonas citrea]KAF7771424.1 hypothetical protein PCIT_a3998 [Pseudoalteromonas citrea]
MDLEESWYHGTRTENITKFWPLSHFGDVESAKMVCANKKYKDGHNGDPYIVEVKLKINENEVFEFIDVGSPNPKSFAVEMLKERWRNKISDELAKDIEEVRVKLINAKKEANGKTDLLKERKEFAEVLIKHGIKAISYPNVVESKTKEEVSLCIIDSSAIEIISHIAFCESEAERLWNISSRNQ